MYGCIDYDLLYVVCFYSYAVIPKVLGLKQSKFDPCIFFRKSEKGETRSIVVCYVDNFFIMGNPEHVDEMKKNSINSLEK